MESNISGLRDDQLLGLIRRKHEVPDSASDAWLELYRRHVRYILWCVRRTTSFVGRGLASEDIVEETFAEVYLRTASGFTSGQYQCDEDARRHVRVWLGKIARFKTLAAIESRSYQSIDVRDPELLDLRVDQGHATFSAPDIVRTNTEDVAKTAEAILSPDELEILWLKMHYFDQDTRQSWVPAQEVEQVCKKQGISKDTFRKRYDRSLDKIKEAMTNAFNASQPDKRRI